jgi:predicted dehydrogenase
MEPLRLGIVGANPARGWARDAHAPALARLPQYRLAAVSARTQAQADEARAVFGAARAYGDSIDLAQSPDLDVVAVTIKVPEHRAVVMAALAAGKHVYCEWPLGCNVAEAREMAGAVKPGQHVMIGLQGLSAPAIRQAIKLISQGALGRLKILRAFSPTAGWGAVAPRHYAYLQDKRTGATFEAIAGGHTLAVIEALAGSYLEVDARSSTLVENVLIHGSSEAVARTCADHLMILGKHDKGCVSSLEVIGGVASQAFCLELVGETGSLKITGGQPGGFQVGNLHLHTAISSEAVPEPVAPELGSAPAAYLAEAYAQFAEQIRTGRKAVPDFDTALKLTELLAKVDLAASTGLRQGSNN